MLVRIKGRIEDIQTIEGRKKSDNSPWAKKVYTVRDTTYDKEEYNTKVCVDDFGKLDPNTMEPVFLYKSNHIIGEEVDLACYLETNGYGFTNVKYGKPYADIEKHRDSNVIYPDANQDTEKIGEPAFVQTKQEESSDLPF